MNNDIEMLTLDMLRAVEERNAARILEIYDPDVEFVWPTCLPGYGGTHRGAAVQANNWAWTAMWDPLQPTEAECSLSPRIVASSSDEVVVHYKQRGLDGIGGRCEADVLATYRFERGRVTRLQMFYFDPEGVAAFLLRAHGGVEGYLSAER
jgi:ketosteroid isomerase-like protein